MTRVTLAFSLTLALIFPISTVLADSSGTASSLTTIANLAPTVEQAWHDHSTRASFYAQNRAWVFYTSYTSGNMLQPETTGVVIRVGLPET